MSKASRQLKRSPLAATDYNWHIQGASGYNSIMTKALQRVLDAVARLPEREQNALAVAILEEIAADGRWEATLAESPSTLERLADEALAEHRDSRSKPLDPDTL
jgi:hypothetical protein